MGEYEKYRALMEAERNASCEAYFQARSESVDTIHNRKLFDAGFETAWAKREVMHNPQEIERLQSEVAELRKERDDLIAALKKSDDEYLKLEQRLAGQVSDEREVAIRNLRGSAGTFITKRSITENDRRILSRLCADFDAAESQPATTSHAAVGDEK